jgi:hypothetical protein
MNIFGIVVPVLTSNKLEGSCTNCFTRRLKTLHTVSGAEYGLV